MSALTGTSGPGTSGVAAAYRAANSAAVPSTSGESAERSGGVSGEALMRQRLFGVDDPTAELPQYTQWSHPSQGSLRGWLTPADRSNLARVYEVAQRTGTPLSSVDDLATDLGNYRSQEGVIVDHSPLMNMDGNPQFQLFTPANEATAQRILGSKAFTDSGLPTDFLEFELDPGRSAGSRLSPSRLEGLLYDLSPSGSARAENPPSIAPRAPERYAQGLADGSLQQARAEHLRWRASDPMGGHTDWRLADPRDLFEKYEHRVKQVAPMLQEDDKAMFGAMYADAEDKYGVDAPELKKIDVAVRRLAVLRNMGELVDPDRLKEEDEKSGHPRKSLQERGQEAYDKAIREPVTPQVVYVGGDESLDVHA